MEADFPCLFPVEIGSTVEKDLSWLCGFNSGFWTGIPVQIISQRFKLQVPFSKFFCPHCPFFRRGLNTVGRLVPLMHPNNLIVILKTIV